ncbi:MAG: hypothetical protein ACRCTK_04200, partial [Alphaproteobacteria bacterium]
MKKKIISSVVITAYCFNSLPVLAGLVPFGGGLEALPTHAPFSGAFSSSSGMPGFYGEQAERDASL